MNRLELRRTVLAALLAFAAITMLTACETTGESPTAEETGAGTGPCECLDGDIECREDCILDPPS